MDFSLRDKHEKKNPTPNRTTGISLFNAPQAYVISVSVERLKSTYEKRARDASFTRNCGDVKTHHEIEIN